MVLHSTTPQESYDWQVLFSKQDSLRFTTTTRSVPHQWRGRVCLRANVRCVRSPRSGMVAAYLLCDTAGSS